ncbi:flagellar filament capping protein FliD [Zymobacter sp. IVIA_12111.31 C1]|uniref:flagellar filament capping protein FliD n=1 Tax=Zymobacter sp. IVIA_12111.31 C1 TaxID=3394854 RepID=UPI0039C4CF49
MATTSSTTSSTSTSSGLGSLNFGSGASLDLDKYYSQLEAAEQSKLATYDTQKTSVETKISAYSTIQSSLDALKSQAEALTADNFQKSATATTSAVAYLATATDNSISGTYDIQVNQLATTQSNASAKVSDKTSTLGSGTITLQQGTGDALSISVTDASLVGVRDAINSAKDSKGNKLNISAAVISNSDGSSYLTVSSTTTGSANAFTISATGDSGLTDVVSNMSVKREATNAQFSVNGVDLEASSNKVTDAVPGLELTLSSVSTSPETTTVATNTSDWETGVTNFVSSYNSFLSTMSSLTQYNSTDSSDTGALVGDSGARTIRSQIKTLLSNENLAKLKDYGITAISLDKTSSTKPAGTLQVDSTKLQQAMKSNPEGFKTTLAATDGKSGIMNQIVAKVDEIENSKTGILTTNTKTLNDKVTAITSQKERATTASEYRLKMYKQSFTKLVQFKTTMDTQIESIKAQFEALKKSS